MAAALAEGVVKSGAFAGRDIGLSDVHRPAAEALAAKLGAAVAESNEDLASRADALVLAVKPGDAVAALSGVSRVLQSRLVVSIVAGLSTRQLADAAGAAARIVRGMPNTPALVGKGAAAYALGPGATDSDAALAETLFGSVGVVVRVREELLDVVTGLSGSGPAFVYTVIEALADGGVLMGLPRDLALRLAAQTVAGAAEMVASTGQHPGVLRDQVASPGGTTIAGLEAIEAAGLRAALIAAVRAATERSKELGRGS
jgi:pyrroline-5-carboxylate reductase